MAYSLVELIEILTKLIGDWEMQFVQQYTDEGFTPRQLEYIDTIHRLGNPNLGEIARELNLSKPSVTAIVEKLAVKGYVQKFQSDEDRRSFHDHLNARGKKLVEIHNETHQKIADLFRKNMDEKDIKTLVRLLNKMFAKM